MAALPLGPQSAAGGVSLPDTFHGELTVSHQAPNASSAPAFGSAGLCRAVMVHLTG